MFSKKSKPKSKVRFEHKDFTNKVQQARNFKRKSTPVSNSAYSSSMRKLGLSTWWSQVFSFLGLAALIYFIYIPNFLSLKQIEIVGASGSNKTILEAESRAVIDDNSFWYPKFNLLFLQTEKIKSKLENNSDVYTVNSIKRNYKTGQLEINVTLKYEKFLLFSDGKVYDIYNDGTMKGLSGLTTEEQWQNENNPNMIKLKFSHLIPETEKLPFLSQEMVEKIDSFNTKIESRIDQVSWVELKIPTLSVFNPELELAQITEDSTAMIEDKSATEDNIEPEPGLEEPVQEVQQMQVDFPVDITELSFTLPRSKTLPLFYSIQIATSQNPETVTDKLFLLLSQMNPDRFANLSYIDMRVESKAFVCLIDTPCAEITN